MLCFKEQLGVHEMGSTSLPLLFFPVDFLVCHGPVSRASLVMEEDCKQSSNLALPIMTRQQSCYHSALDPVDSIDAFTVPVEVAKIWIVNIRQESDTTSSYSLWPSRGHLIFFCSSD